MKINSLTSASPISKTSIKHHNNAASDCQTFFKNKAEYYSAPFYYPAFKRLDDAKDIEQIKQYAKELEQVRNDGKNFDPYQKDLMNDILKIYNDSFIFWQTLQYAGSSTANHYVKQGCKKFDFDIPSQTVPQYHLTNYDRSSISKPLSEMGVDENIFFKDVCGIAGGANFRQTEAKSLGSVKYIDGHAFFSGPQLKDIGTTIFIAGETDFFKNNLKGENLIVLGAPGAFHKVGHEFYESIIEFPNLEHISGALTSKRSNLHFPELKRIQGGLKENSSELIFPKLERIDFFIEIEDCKNQNFESLDEIGTKLDIKNSQIGVFGDGDLYIGNDVNIDSSEIDRLNIKNCGRDLKIKNSVVNSLDSLEIVKGDLNLIFSDIKSMKNLKNVGGDVFLCGSNLTPEDFKDVKIGGRIR